MGRLTLIERPEEVLSKLSVTKRERAPVGTAKGVLPFAPLFDHLETILEQSN